MALCALRSSAASSSSLSTFWPVACSQLSSCDDPLFLRLPHPVLAFGQRHEHAAQCLHFLISEAGAMDGGADRACHGVMLLRWKQKAARVELALQMIEEVEQFLARRFAMDGPVFEARRRCGIACTEPFVSIEQHGLAEIDGGK